MEPIRSGHFCSDEAIQRSHDLGLRQSARGLRAGRRLAHRHPLLRGRVRLFLLIFSGRHAELPEVAMLRSSELRVTTEPELALEADGESLGRTPASYRVRQAVLPVILPPGVAVTPEAVTVTT